MKRKQISVIFIIYIIMMVILACSGKPDTGLTLNVEVVGNGYISKSPSKKFYEEGEKVVIRADTKVYDWKFSKWEGDALGSTNPILITMDSDKTIKAVFVEKEKYSVKVETNGNGNVTLSPSEGPYTEGIDVIVKASPNDGYMFDHWEGDLSESTNPTKITVDSNKTIKAIFSEARKLDIKIKGLGSVAIDPKKAMNNIYKKGETIKVIANAVRNISTFDHWEGGTINNSTNREESITINDDITLTAVFNTPTNDKITFYEDFETNDGKWSTKYNDYTLYSASDYDVDIDINKPPFVQEDTVHGGNWSAKFGKIEGHQFTWFQRTVTIEKDSDVIFFYKVSSDSENRLYFLVDYENMERLDEVRDKFSGKIDWTQYTGHLNAGTHTLKWMYFKKYPDSVGQDTAWVDDIIIKESLPRHKLNIDITGNGKVIRKVNGQIDFGPYYEEGDLITLEAVPRDDATFTTWGGDASGTNKTTSVTMSQNDINVTAEFTGETKEIDWLIMMYVGGDCNLEPYLWSDLNEAEHGIYKLQQTNAELFGKVKVLALWDGIADFETLAPKGTKIYELGPDERDPEDVNISLSERIEISGDTKDLTEKEKWWIGEEVDISDGNTVTSFLNWAKESYPNHKNTMLVLSDHGGGPRSRNKTQVKGAIWDDTTGGIDYFLETKELSEALNNAGFSGENKLSILGFDACLMASVEEAYEHRTVANYYVSSLQTEQGDGWEYDKWIPSIGNNMTAKDFGIMLVKSYEENFKEYPSDDQTLSCTDLSKMDNLKTSLDNLGKAIMDKGLTDDIKLEFKSSQSFSGVWADLHEVGDFMNRLSSTAVKTEAKAVEDVMKEAIVYSWADQESGNYYGEDTGKGLDLIGRMGFTEKIYYDTNLFSFADGDWAKLYSEWYPYRP